MGVGPRARVRRYEPDAWAGVGPVVGCGNVGRRRVARPPARRATGKAEGGKRKAEGGKRKAECGRRMAEEDT